MGWHPIRDWRLRKAQEKQKDRELQLQLAAIAAQQNQALYAAIESIGTQHAKSLEQVGGMVSELARSNQQSSEVLQRWLESFKTVEAPTASVMRDEDEYRKYELEKLQQMVNEDSTLQPEFALALELRKQWADGN